MNHLHLVLQKLDNLSLVSDLLVLDLQDLLLLVAQDVIDLQDGRFERALHGLLVRDLAALADLGRPLVLLGKLTLELKVSVIYLLLQLGLKSGNA